MNKWHRRYCILLMAGFTFFVLSCASHEKDYKACEQVLMKFSEMVNNGMISDAAALISKRFLDEFYQEVSGWRIINSKELESQINRNVE